MFDAPKPSERAMLVVIVAANILMHVVAGAMLIDATKAVFSPQPEGSHYFDGIAEPLSTSRMNPYSDACQYLGA
jgi:hypothetical protein